MPFDPECYGDRKSDTFLSGKHVVLRVLTEDDVANTNWYDWFNDELTCQRMQKHYFPNTREKQREFLTLLDEDPQKIQLGIVARKDNKLIGVVSLGGIDFINRNGEVSIVIGDNEYRELVYAMESMRLILEHGFFTLNLHKITAGAIESLNPWLRLLKDQFGFRDEGVLREHVYKDGRYVDAHRIGLLKEEFRKAMTGREKRS